jgi:hypothetical protein
MRVTGDLIGDEFPSSPSTLALISNIDAVIVNCQIHQDSKESDFMDLYFKRKTRLVKI